MRICVSLSQASLKRRLSIGGIDASKNTPNAQRSHFVIGICYICESQNFNICLFVDNISLLVLIIHLATKDFYFIIPDISILSDTTYLMYWLSKSQLPKYDCRLKLVLRKRRA